MPVPALRVGAAHVIDHHRQADLPDGRDRVRQVLHVDPKLHVPAQVLHHRRKLLRTLKRHAAAVVQLPAAEEMIEAQRADTERVPAAKLRDRHGLVGHRHPAQPLGMPRQRVEHRRIVAAMRAALHQPAISEAQRIEHVEILRKRRVGRGVAAVGTVRKPVRRPEHMGVGVPGVRRRLDLGLHRIERSGTYRDHAATIPSMPAARPAAPKLLCSGRQVKAQVKARDNAKPTR